MSIRRLPSWLPLAVLVAAFALFAALGGLDAVSLETIERRYAWLRGFVAAHRAAALLLFVATYAALVGTVIFPAAFVLTIAGGVFFGPIEGAIASIVGVTTGGGVGFLAARHALAHGLSRRLGGRALRLRDGIARDGLTYVLVLRLTPLLPFWLVTLAAAAAGLRARDFVAATLIGVTPAAFIFASLGASAAQTLAAGGRLSVGAMVSSPSVVAPLAGLALLAFAGAWVQAAVRRGRARRGVGRDPRAL